MRLNELAHDANAFPIVKNHYAGSVLLEQVFGALEVAILSDDDPGNSIQQGRSGAHDAGAKSADQSHLLPVSSAACIAQANRFGVRRGISALYSQVMPPGHDLAVLVR